MNQQKDQNKYLWISINEGNLYGHIKKLKQKCEVISKEIETIRIKESGSERRNESPIKTFWSLSYGSTDIWNRGMVKHKKEGIMEIERIQGKAFKRIFDFLEWMKSP